MDWLGLIFSGAMDWLRLIFSAAMDWLGLISYSARGFGLGGAGAALNLSLAPALSAEDTFGLVLQSIVLGCIPRVCLVHEACARRAEARRELLSLIHI